MKNIEGIEIPKNDIDNTVNIAMDLQYYGYSFEYFHEKYASKLSKENALTIWNKALKIMERDN